MVAFQVPGDPSALHVMAFNDALVVDDGDCITPFDAKQLSVPHSVAMLDFDGDCMSDLFLTTEHAGETWYEIYARRERGKTVDVDSMTRKLRPTAQVPTAKVPVEQRAPPTPQPAPTPTAAPEPAAAGATAGAKAGPAQGDQFLTGLGSFCLVSREKLPDWTDNLVNFADMDNDGMIDMFYVDRMSNEGLNLFIHYNKLENVDRAKNKN